MMQFSKFLFLLALALPCFSSPLGFTSDYNVLTFGSTTVVNSDITGATAVGGAGSFTNFGLATGDGGANGAVPPGGPGVYNLVVGGSLFMQNGELKRGSAVVAGSVSATNFGFPDGGLVSGPVPVDFAALEQEALADSAEFAQIAMNGSAVAQWGGLTLTGTDNALNVFTLNLSDLNVHTLNINVPSGAGVLINVLGINGSFQNAGLFLNGSQFEPGQAGAWSEVLWNFSEATSLTLSSVKFGGSILAPKAALTVQNGQVNGQIVASSLYSTADIHNFRFNGTEPNEEPAPVPEPATFAFAAVGVGLVLVGAARRRR